MMFDAPRVTSRTNWTSSSDAIDAEPVLPQTGDGDIRTTYAAIGEALGNWQDFELGLATLYARFLGSPCSLDRVRQFGAGHQGFRTRIDAIETAAEAFFAGCPSDDTEDAFGRLCYDAIVQSMRQARIAQGLVRNVAHDAAAPCFALELPWHAHDRARLVPVNMLGSEAILEMSEDFRRLAARVESLNRQCAALAA